MLRIWFSWDQTYMVLTAAVFMVQMGTTSYWNDVADCLTRTATHCVISQGRADSKDAVILGDMVYYLVCGLEKYNFLTS